MSVYITVSTGALEVSIMYILTPVLANIDITGSILAIVILIIYMSLRIKTSMQFLIYNTRFKSVSANINLNARILESIVIIYF